MNGKNNITSKQMALLNFVNQTGMGMITLPTILSREVGHDGWISVLLTGMFSIIVGSLIVFLLKRYSNKNIFDINKLLFGNILGLIFNVILSMYLLLAASASARVFSVFLRITLLPKTPVFVIVPFVMLPSIYLVSCGLKYVVRFKYISVLSYTVSLIYLVLIIKYYHFSFLLPVGEAGIKQIILSMKTSFFTFLGVEVISFLFPEITDKKNISKWYPISITLSTLFSAIIVVTSTALFGESFLKIQTIPLFNMSRVYNAPILERVDLYLIALWFVVMGCSMRVYMFAAYHSLNQVFNLKDSKGLVLLFFSAVFILSRLPKDVNEVFMFRQTICEIGLGVSFFLVLCLCLSFVNTKGVKTGESS